MKHDRRPRPRSLALAAALLLSLLQLGCQDEPPVVEPEPEAFAAPELSVAQVAGLVEAGTAVPVDANSPETRQAFGTVPHARLLSSSSQYDVAAELPPEHSTKLVFYCANEDCRASDGAAARAFAAGYTDVHVMRAGITGWRDAGKPTVPAPAS